MLSLKIAHKQNKIAASVLIVILSWPLVLGGCVSTIGADAVASYNRAPLTVAVSKDLSPQQVENIMATTLVMRKWTVVQKSPQEVVGTLDHRGYQAKVFLKVEGDLIKILTESYYAAPADEKAKPKLPMSWLKNIQKDLERNIKLARTVS
jgi:hypothetical protein